MRHLLGVLGMMGIMAGLLRASGSNMLSKLSWD